MNKVDKISFDNMSATEFIDKYVLQRKPAIISSFFANAEISRLNSFSKIQKYFSDTSVLIQEEYSKVFRKSNDYFKSKSKLSTLPEYLEILKKNPSSPLLITEHPVPDEIIDLLITPEICNYRLGVDGRTKILYEFFLAGRGNIAHLHFDWDHRHVFLYQVFGRKRIVLFSPEKSALLNPLFNMSQLSLEKFSRLERDNFVKYLSGYQCVLEPGDAIYIPPLMWHYLEYIDLAMSIGIRFGCTKYGRLYSECFHPNYYLQNFAWYTLDQQDLCGEALNYYLKIINIYLNSSKGVNPYKEMTKIFREIYSNYCRNSIQGQVWQSTEMIELLEANKGFKMGSLYKQKSLLV